MKAVLDTNVLVSAALAAREERWGPARWLVQIALIAQRRFEHVTSDQLINALRRVLERPGMLEVPAVESFIETLSAASTFVRIYDVPMGCRDPNDDKVIETAMNANVDVIVSRDLDLHDARARRAIGKTGVGIRDRPIVVCNVRGFLAALDGTPRFSPLVPATLAA